MHLHEFLVNRLERCRWKNHAPASRIQWWFSSGFNALHLCLQNQYLTKQGKERLNSFLEAISIGFVLYDRSEKISFYCFSQQAHSQPVWTFRCSVRAVTSQKPLWFCTLPQGTSSEMTLIARIRILSRIFWRISTETASIQQLTDMELSTKERTHYLRLDCCAISTQIVSICLSHSVQNPSQVLWRGGNLVLVLIWDRFLWLATLQVTPSCRHHCSLGWQVKLSWANSISKSGGCLYPQV